jgi:hypothetical protein
MLVLLSVKVIAAMTMSSRPLMMIATDLMQPTFGDMPRRFSTVGDLRIPSLPIDLAEVGGVAWGVAHSARANVLEGD